VVLHCFGPPVFELVADAHYSLLDEEVRCLRHGDMETSREGGRFGRHSHIWASMNTLRARRSVLTRKVGRSLAARICAGVCCLDGCLGGVFEGPSDMSVFECHIGVMWAEAVAGSRAHPFPMFYIKN